MARGTVEYAELLIAIAIAAYVAYGSVLDSLGVEELIQATAGLLIVLAFAMVRERHERLRVAALVDAAAPDRMAGRIASSRSKECTGAATG